jgi:type I restriction enzyme S subunit
METLQKGASYPAVTDSEVKGVLITFPESYLEQEHIVKRLDNLLAESLKFEAIYKNKISTLKELKQSILQKAFTGELTSKSIDSLNLSIPSPQFEEAHP